MPTAATRTDVEDLLGRDLSADSTRVDRLIERAEGILAADMPGLTFELGEETVTIDPDGDDIIILPRYPVRYITELTVDGVTLAATEYDVDTLGRVRRRSAGVNNPHDATGVRGWWPDSGAIITVDYGYGWGATAVPAGVTAVVAELVAARYVNPEQVTQQSIGDRSQTFAAAAGAGDDLTAGQRHRLRHWRRNRYGAVRVRS